MDYSDLSQLFLHQTTLTNRAERPETGHALEFPRKITNKYIPSGNRCRNWYTGSLTVSVSESQGVGPFGFDAALGGLSRPLCQARDSMLLPEFQNHNS